MVAFWKLIEANFYWRTSDSFSINCKCSHISTADRFCLRSKQIIVGTLVVLPSWSFSALIRTWSKAGVASCTLVYELYYSGHSSCYLLCKMFLVVCSISLRLWYTCVLVWKNCTPHRPRQTLKRLLSRPLPGSGLSPLKVCTFWEQIVTGCTRESCARSRHLGFKCDGS